LISPEGSKITIRGAEVWAHHGVGDAEQELGGRYSFDLSYQTDISGAAGSDDLEQTVDYVAVYNAARDVIVKTRRHLLESIVSEIGAVLLERFPGISSVEIRLRKMHAPILGIVDSVEIEYRLNR
jgi:dihydroneopterin aldolase